MVDKRSTCTTERCYCQLHDNHGSHGIMSPLLALHNSLQAETCKGTTCDLLKRIEELDNPILQNPFLSYLRYKGWDNYRIKYDIGADRALHNLIEALPQDYPQIRTMEHLRLVLFNEILSDGNSYQTNQSELAGIIYLFPVDVRADYVMELIENTQNNLKLKKLGISLIDVHNGLQMVEEAIITIELIEQECPMPQGYKDCGNCNLGCMIHRN